MALNFPASPSTGDIHNASNNLSYFFDGVKWITQGSYNTGTINAIKLDSLTSSFNGSLTTFNLTSNSISVKPANALSVMISLGGVIQEPTTAYSLNSEAGTITFTSAPASNTAFFGIVYSRLPQLITTVDDGTITNAKVSTTAAIDKSKLDISDATTSVSGFMSTSDKTKLDGIEASATADQTNAEIRAAVEAATDSNVFTDADHTKLNGIEASATADQTAAEIRTLVESATDSNVFTDADHTKLNAIEANAINASNAAITNKLPLAGGTITGDVTFTGDSANIVFDKSDNALEFADNAKLTFGADADLQLFHDGSQSLILDNGTGQLRIGGENTVSITNAAGTESYARFLKDGQAELYHNGTLKFNTDSSGVRIVGDLVAVNQIFLGDSTSTSIGRLSLGADLDGYVYHDGSNYYIENATGNLLLRPKTGEEGIKLIPDGAVELYHDGTKKVETSASGLDLPDNSRLRFGNSQDLQIYHDSNNSFIQNTSSNKLKISADEVEIVNSANSEFLAKFVADGTAQLYHNNVARLSTSAIGVTVSGKLTTSGDIIINSDYPVLSFIDTNNDSDYRLTNANGNFILFDISNSATRFTVTNAGLLKVHGNVEPEADNTRALGSSSKRFTTLHSAALNTGDINMSNLNDSGNEVDGSKGSWSIQEGADDLFLINRVSGKKYKFNLTEIT